MKVDDSSGSASRFFLFIGNATSDAAVSKLKASGLIYVQKKLESNPANWEAIIGLIEDGGLLGVIGKLTADNYRLMVRTDYSDVAARLFSALGKVRHVVFVHESVLADGRQSPDSSVGAADRGQDTDDSDSEDTYYDYLAEHYFEPPSDEVRETVNESLSASAVNVITYRSNAELSVLAASFIEDNERNLLFRIYVPDGRIYADEAAKLLSLFREWLTGVKRQRVRQDGYRTGSGQVFEFFGEESTTPSELRSEFADFSRFLDACVQHPEDARQQLAAAGISTSAAEDLVRRYAKETRRMNLDLRQARESRLLSIRHQLEAKELADGVSNEGRDRSEIERFIESAVPAPTGIGAALESLSVATGSIPGTYVTINQQIIDTVEGSVLQGVQGTANLGLQAQELLDLVRSFGGDQVAALESDLHEMEDADARGADRLAAKQRL